MAVTSVSTFKSGNSEAVRLPKGFGFGVGTRVRMEREGDRIVLTPERDQDAVRRALHSLADDLEALGPVEGGREVRDVDWWPDRAER